jgi:hypothetical protein
MSITQAALVPKLPSNGSMVDALEGGLCAALQRILDAHVRSLAIITDTLSNPANTVTIQELLSELKLQQDNLVANISESLSLIDEMWLLLQSHFEQQFAAIGDAVDQDETSAIGPAARRTVNQ